MYEAPKASSGLLVAADLLDCSEQRQKFTAAGPELVHCVFGRLLLAALECAFVPIE